MFKRFHEKSHNNSRGSVHPNAHSYQQISKSKSVLKNKYSQRYRQRTETVSEEMPSLEVLRSEAFVYQGFVKQQEKHGEGVMMLRNGTVIVGKWYNDLLEGRAVIYTSLGCKVLAQFAQGRFNGWALASYRQHLLKCVLFYEGHLDGEKLTFDAAEGLWVSAKCAYDGRLLSITHVEKGRLSDPPTFLQSEELREIMARYIVNQERFVDFSVIDQLESNSSTYIGFVDEERRPCGLGVIYTPKELYAGNFFEGTLEHYGRMLFENGQVYHGEMLGGVFWGRGLYYSPVRNLTHILITDEYEQLVEKQLEGYYMIDIVPNLGGATANSAPGIRGNTLRLIEDAIEPYYRKQFAFQRHSLDQSNNSEYGRSEDMNAVSKDEKEKEREKERQKERQKEKENEYQLIGSLSPGKMRAGEQKWLKFAEEQEVPMGYKRTYSLDKREAAAMRRAEAVDIIKPKNSDPVKSKQSDLIRPQPVQYESIQIKENLQREEAEDFLKQSPPQTKLMQEIPFNPDGYKLNKESKSLELDAVSLTLRNSTLHSNPDPQRVKQAEAMSKVNELSQSQSSQHSGNSQQLLTILEKNKGYRKRIFY